LIKDWGKFLFTFIAMYFISSTNKNLEIVALRSQLAIYKEKELNLFWTHHALILLPNIFQLNVNRHQINNAYLGIHS
jgi:hypothetical protein